MAPRHSRSLLVALVAAVSFALLAAVAFAHVERTSYWPNPKPDKSVHPAAGGHVPKAKSLASAVRRKQPRGVTVRVVCRPHSMKYVRRAIRRARRGFRYRPTGHLIKLTKKKARRLIAINRKLRAKCHFREIQAAVTRSNNNDRVVIMPGTYTEPSSRKVPAFPKKCNKYRETSEKGKGAVSYAFQYHCPNAQNLVAVIGRKDTGKKDPPSSPTGRPDPHGLPNAGRCIRCNLQMEGSGPTPDDVVIDAGRVKSHDHGPLGSKKDVTLKVDRADGFVARNFKLRHAAEHDLYTLEVDGYLLNRMKFFYAGEYGTLTFTSDHGVTDTCDAKGNGDSGVYPGGAPDSNGKQRRPDFYPKNRLNQLITRCDSHHNNLGYSGTMGNATHVTHTNFYGNATGIATDSFYAGGHPGFPQSAAVFENNHIYSNNFNVYGPKSDVVSRTPVPIGVGILIAGGNEDQVRGNYIWNNWRRGTMLIAVPDAVSCAPNPDAGSAPCTPKSPATTSNFNQYHNNIVSRTPAGRKSPNGVDFWWDEFPTNHANCWFDNVGIDGTKNSFTSDPPPFVQHGKSIPGFLPEDCSNDAGSTGLGDPQKESVLVACAGEVEAGSQDPTACDWFRMPKKPSPSGGKNGPANAGFPVGFDVRSELGNMCNLVSGTSLTCSPFRYRLGGP